MKCNQCGTDYDGKFCPNCGAPNQAEANGTQTQQSTPTYTQPVVQQPPQKIKKPIFKKWWFWVIIVVVIIAIAANLGGNGDKSPSKDNDSSTSAKDETFGINDTAVFKSIKVTANELKESSGTDFFKPADGKTFVGVQFTIENTSDEDQIISSVLLFDAYVDGVKCDYSVTANCVFTDGTLDGTISAGKKMTGYYSVEVPANWSELELQVMSSWLSSSKAAFVFNKSSTTSTSAKDETFGINDTAVFTSIKVTANELKESSGTDYFKPADGKIFVGVQFTIENTSDEDQIISSVLLFDAYVDGVKCDYSVTANCVFTDSTLDGTISAGKKMVGYYSVEVPANWSELELQVKSSWLSSSKAAFVFNK